MPFSFDIDRDVSLSYSQLSLFLMLIAALRWYMALGLSFILFGMLPSARAIDSSSSSSDAPLLRPIADPSSGSILRAKIGAAGEEESSALDEAATKQKRIRQMDVFEGRNSSVRLMTKVTTRRNDEENWSFLGANPKKLKHRRLDAVEVAKRSLEENQWMNPDGSLDMKGALKLIEAEEEREAAPDGRTVRTKIYSLEELDKIHPTEEGNIRLGLKPKTRNVTVDVHRERWERSSHFVEMRKPGSKPQGLLAEDMLNYRAHRRNITIFVEGSVEVRFAIRTSASFRAIISCIDLAMRGKEAELAERVRECRVALTVGRDRYAVELPLSSTIEELKSAVWAWERHYRHEVCGLRGKDEEAGFRIEEQQLVHNSGLLQPDGRPLRYYNLSDYALLRVVPPFIEASEEQRGAMAEWYHELTYWREVRCPCVLICNLIGVRVCSARPHAGKGR